MKNGIAKIVVRGTNWVGDSVLTIPAVRALRKVFPSASISMISPGSLAELWESEDTVDRVIPVTRPTRPAEKIRLIRALRRDRYDVGVLFPNSFESALWFFLGGVRSRLGYARYGRGILLDRGVAPPAGGKHQVHHYLSLIRTLGDFTVDPAPSIRIPGSALSWARNALRNEGVGGDSPLVGINPGATYGEAKCWPRERFAELIRLIRSRLDARVVIVGAEKEISQAEDLCREAGAVSMAGKTSIMRLAAVADLCSVFVSNDTGPMHIACAVATPVVAIFGPTDPEATGPLGKSITVRKDVECAPCLKRVCPTDHRCMKSISSEEVFLAVKELLGESKIPNQ